MDFPCKINDVEMELMDDALTHLTDNVDLALDWYTEACNKKLASGKVAARKQFHYKRPYSHVEDCLCQLT
ncbi:unnamed protein product [Leptosia nina]|uniref:Uncharacterized protein n=1 Tax=Leptosia nina TaxID=320188 RepID=A0AAV1K561_9NEOP